MISRLTLNDTIAAVSTPVGEGGIGIVRLSGERALSIADEIFLSKNGTMPSEARTYTTHYGRVTDGKRPIDEVILTVMRAPKSYTKEDIVEINCHGGILPLKKILELVTGLGARIAEPGEFTKRAFLNGRIDLTQAEAVLDVIRSKTDAGLVAALNQLEGRLFTEVRAVKNEIMDFYAHLEAAIDFPDEELEIYDSTELSGKMDSALDRLNALLEGSKKGRILREGISTVICGKPNVGKSTLMNAFLREDRVIVTHIPGTTRDVIEEVINIDGIPLRVADTAGIIESDSLPEAEGVKKSRSRIKDADLVLLVLDNSRGFEETDRAVLRMVKGKKAIAVINKIDLPVKLDKDTIAEELNGAQVVEISASKMTNLDVLEKAISQMVWSGQAVTGHNLLLTNVRHADAVRRAGEGIRKASESLEKRLSPEFIAIDIKEALESLGEITGETVLEDLLERIFGEFCIGK